MQKHSYRSIRVVWGFLLLSAISLLPAARSFSAVTAAHPAPKWIMQKAAGRYDFLRDYTVDARLKIESPSTHVSNMDVRIFFKRPDRMHFEAKSGFAVFPRRGAFVGNPANSLRMVSRPCVVRSERIGKQDCWVVGGKMCQPKERANVLVWVDKRSFALHRLRVERDYATSEEIEFQYGGPEQIFPLRTTARVFLQPIGGRGAKPSSPLGPSTRVQIEFSNYRINTGLSDKIFKDDRQR